MCIKRVLSVKQRVLALLTSFLPKKEFKSIEMLVLALVSLNLHKLMRLHVSQCFHCVTTNNVHKIRFSSEITRFSAFNVVFAKKRNQIFVLALVTLISHNSFGLHVSQQFHCVKTDNGHKTRFWLEITLSAHVTSFLLEQTRLNAKKCLFER